MRKAKLYLSPIERGYIEVYGETAETTMLKLKEQGIAVCTVSEIVQKRMDEIWQKMKSEHEKHKITDLEAADCPFLT